MLKSCVWTLAAIAHWIAGILAVEKHHEIWTVENGHPVMRATMPSPAAPTLWLWALSAAAATQAIVTALRATRRNVAPAR
jgi:hypothetical protein